MQVLERPQRAPTLAAYNSHLLGGIGKVTRDFKDEATVALIDSVFNYYAGCLDVESRAMRQLMKLGIYRSTSLKSLSIGISNRTLGLQLPSEEVPEGEAVRGALERLGLRLPTGGEFFRGALVFPLRNSQGEIVEAYGQRLAPRLSQGTASQLYWSLGSARFFNHTVLEEHNSIVICETPFQALVFLARGVPNAVSPVGRWGFNEVQLDALDRARPHRVVMAYGDGSDAQRAAKLIEQAVSALGIRVIQHPVAQQCRPRRPPPPVEPDAIQSVVAQLHHRSEYEAGHGGVRV